MIWIITISISISRDGLIKENRWDFLQNQIIDLAGKWRYYDSQLGIYLQGIWGSPQDTRAYKRAWRLIVGSITVSKFIHITSKPSNLSFFLVLMAQSNLLGTFGVLKMGEGMRKRLKISELIKTYAKTLIGRCMNPPEQDMQALLLNLPKIWKLEDRVVGTDLGFGKFQFDFQTEEDIQMVMMNQPFHFDYWMLALARWQPKKSQVFPSEIPFWVRVLGVPMAFRTVANMQSIGDAIGRTVALDVRNSRVHVVVDGFSELCFETNIDFKGGEFYDGEEAVVSLRYEKLFGYCKDCGSLCHKEDKCPLKAPAVEPAKSSEARCDNGGWVEGGKHEERARSYKGVVLNGTGNHQGKERDTRDYYGKGKGKMEDRSDSKWVRRSDKSQKKTYHSRGNYNGEENSTRSRHNRQEEAKAGSQGNGERELSGHRRSEIVQMETLGDIQRRERSVLYKRGLKTCLLLSSSWLFWRPKPMVIRLWGRGMLWIRIHNPLSRSLRIRWWMTKRK